MTSHTIDKEKVREVLTFTKHKLSLNPLAQTKQMKNIIGLIDDIGKALGI